MNEEFDGVSRISRRIEARRAEVRSRLETAPELAAWLGAVRETFGTVQLTHLAIGDWSHGDPDRIYILEDGTRGHAFIPAPYHRPPATRRGKAASMRAREAVGQ